MQHGEKNLSNTSNNELLAKDWHRFIKHNNYCIGWIWLWTWQTMVTNCIRVTRYDINTLGEYEYDHAQTLVTDCYVHTVTKKQQQKNKQKNIMFIL